MLSLTWHADRELEFTICAMMIERKEWLLEFIAQVDAADFGVDGARALFTDIKALYAAGDEVSYVTLMTTYFTTLRKYDLTLEQVEGFKLGRRGDDIPTLAKRLKECVKWRRWQKLAMDLATMAEEHTANADISAAVEKVLAEITGNGATRTLISPQDMASVCMESVLARKDKDARAAKIVPCGFAKLDNLTGGFEKGDLIILSAESGAGKSAFAMNVAKNVGQNKPVLYLNSEMSTEQMSLRWASHLSGVSHGKIRCGEISDADEARIMHSLDKIYGASIYTLNIPDLQIASVLAETRRMVHLHGVELVIVDYIGRMDTLNEKIRARDAEWQLMLGAARSLKTMAQELNIVVIMVAQLTKDGGSLAQGSYMKHEADLWLNLRHIPKEDLGNAWPWDSYLEFRKARNVETGKKLCMRFHGDTLTFTDDEAAAKMYAHGDKINPGAGFAGTPVRNRDIPA